MGAQRRSVEGRAPARVRDELTPELLRAAARGDRPAATAFVRHYQARVVALITRMMQPSGLGALVEDVAQETFIRALRALPRFDLEGPAKPSTWLLHIAVRLAINELSRRRPHVVEVEDLRTHESADADSERRELAACLREAIAELSPEYRAAFLLREYEGLSYQEIASELELELGTVKSRLGRAREQLRRRLERLYRETSA